MRRKDLARNIAEGLAGCDWDEVVIKAALTRRLPQGSKSIWRIAQVLAARYDRAYPPSVPEITAMLCDIPALDTLHRRCRETGIWPDPVLIQPHMRPLPAFADLPLPQLPTPRDLADWLLLEDQQLARFADPLGCRMRMRKLRRTTISGMSSQNGRACA
ncbi:hypothetical protein [Halovulum sp. GXIMD14793]